MIPLAPGLQVLGWTLLHFLWQGILVWVIAALALHLGRRQDPRIRYLIGCAALTACVALPVATFLYLQGAPDPGPSLRNPMEALAQKDRLTAQLRFVTPVLPPLGAPDLLERLGTFLQRILPFLVLFWSLGCVGRVLRLLGGWVWLCNLRRAAEEVPGDLGRRVAQIARRMGLLRAVRLGQAPGIHSPMVLGWMRPLLLVPAAFVAGLDPSGLEALLVHELAHIRRNDYLVNLLQCVVEVLLFYHPAVGWISRRVRLEREMCCDDAALAWCEDPLGYAETLARLDEIRAEALAPALAASSAPLLQRIRRILILSGSAHSEASWQRLPRSLALALASLGLLFFSLGITAASARAAASQILPAAPRGWILAGSHPRDYSVGIAPAAGPDGATACWLASRIAAPEGFGTLMQSLDPVEYRGRRVRLSAWLEPVAVENSAQLWMRVDTPDRRGAAFDNMAGRSLAGTSGWKEVIVVLDVDPKASNLAFGVILAGKGRVGVSGVKFEIVGPEVATTGMAGRTRSQGPRPVQEWALAAAPPEDYAVDPDPTTRREGSDTVALSSTTGRAGGFGTLSQSLVASDYLGRRVRFTAWVKAEAVTHSAALWFRADDGMGRALAFDNMDERPLRGTTSWTRLEIVQDVPNQAALVLTGLILNGPGKVWIEGPLLEVVDPGVPLTGTRNVTPSREPANLDFSP